MKYNTKHKKALLEYLETARGRHITVAEIRAHFEAQGNPIGTTTLYRQIDELVREGLLHKYIVDENSAACYEYTGDKPSREPIVHCKCEGCGSSCISAAVSLRPYGNIFRASTISSSIPGAQSFTDCAESADNNFWRYENEEDNFPDCLRHHAGSAWRVRRADTDCAEAGDEE